MKISLLVDNFNTNTGSNKLAKVNIQINDKFLIPNCVLWIGDDKKHHLVTPKCYYKDRFDPITGNYVENRTAKFLDTNLQKEITDLVLTMYKNGGGLYSFDIDDNSIKVRHVKNNEYGIVFGNVIIVTSIFVKEKGNGRKYIIFPEKPVKRSKGIWSENTNPIDTNFRNKITDMIIEHYDRNKEAV